MLFSVRGVLCGPDGPVAVSRRHLYDCAGFPARVPDELGCQSECGKPDYCFIYLPTLVYFAKERKLAECFGSVVACGFVYGATDFSCARGVWDCLWNRDKEWTPTNSKSQEGGKMGLC